MKRNLITSIWESRKPSTISKYCLSLRKFFSFCGQNAILIQIPFSSMTIASYLEHLKEQTTAKSALSNALLCIKWLHGFMPGLNNCNDPANDRFLSKLVESSNRNTMKLKKRKSPLTPEMINGIINSLPSDPTLTQLRNCLIPILSYALLLRHDKTSHINCNHLDMNEEGLKVFIPTSKTDTYRDGRFAYLSIKNRSIFDLLLAYLRKSHLEIGMNHFLFGPIVFNKNSKRYEIQNKKLPYEVFNKVFKDAMGRLGTNPDSFGTHSARSGGASCLAPHVTEYDLMLTGRWSDPRSIGNYVETPPEKRFKINEILDINA